MLKSYEERAKEGDRRREAGEYVPALKSNFLFHSRLVVSLVQVFFVSESFKPFHRILLRYLANARFVCFNNQLN